MLAERQSKLSELQLIRHRLQEDSQNRWNNRQERLVVIAISKTPGLDQIREAGRLVALSTAGDLRVAERLEHIEFLGFVTLLRVPDGQEEFFELVCAFGLSEQQINKPADCDATYLVWLRWDSGGRREDLAAAYEMLWRHSCRAARWSRSFSFSLDESRLQTEPFC